MRGRLAGPLEALRPNFSISLDQPRVSSIVIPELWSGRLEGTVGEGVQLAMETAGPLLVGALTADFAPNGWPSSLRLKRGGGVFNLKEDQRGYRWDAAGLRLDGVQLVFPSQQRSESVGGQLSGSGQLAFAPLSLNGRVTVDAPRMGAFRCKKWLWRGVCRTPGLKRMPF